MRKRVYYTMVGWIDVEADDDGDAIRQFNDVAYDDRMMVANLDLCCGAELGHVEEIDEE